MTRVVAAGLAYWNSDFGGISKKRQILLQKCILGGLGRCNNSNNIHVLNND